MVASDINIKETSNQGAEKVNHKYILYTKEFKGLVNALEHQGQLNRVALMNVNKQLDSHFKATCVLIIISLLLSAYAVFHTSNFIIPFLFGSGLICLFILGLKDMSQLICNRFSILCTTGQRTEGLVIKFHSNREKIPLNPSYWYCTYSFQVKEQPDRKVVGKCRLPIKMVQTDFSKEQNITIVYDPENPKRNIPLIPEINSRYNLRMGAD